MSSHSKFSDDVIATLLRRRSEVSIYRASTFILLLVFTCILFYKREAIIPPQRHSEKHVVVVTQPSPPRDIPNQVWQLYMTSGTHTEQDHSKAIEDTRIDGSLTSSWYPVDGAWNYAFLGTEAGEDFVRQHFADQPKVVEAFTHLKLPVMRSDFLRYLLLAGDGGYYADSDVALVKPLHQWMPAEFQQKARAMIGLEIDHGLDGNPDSRRLQFCQYTLATVKGHPIMMNMVHNITDSLWERAHNGSISKLELRDKDVMDITGPTAFKEIVFDHLSKQAGEAIGWRNVSAIKEPKLIGDTVILPINYFGAGQKHSGSDKNSTDKLVLHEWKGTWRHWEEPIYK